MIALLLFMIKMAALGYICMLITAIRLTLCLTSYNSLIIKI
jgi:hypothetical protein